MTNFFSSPVHLVLLSIFPLAIPENIRTTRNTWSTVREGGQGFTLSQKYQIPPEGRREKFPHLSSLLSNMNKLEGLKRLDRDDNRGGWNIKNPHTMPEQAGPPKAEEGGRSCDSGPDMKDRQTSPEEEDPKA